MNLELSKADADWLIAMLDIAVRARGLDVAERAAALAKIIRTTAQAKPQLVDPAAVAAVEDAAA